MKDPLMISMATYTLMISLAFWGGVASYMRKVKSGLTARFSITELIGELFISGFVGLITFYLCESAKIDQMISAALVGIAGHMGSRAIFLIEKYLQSKFLKDS